MKAKNPATYEQSYKDYKNFMDADEIYNKKHADGGRGIVDTDASNKWYRQKLDREKKAGALSDPRSYRAHAAGDRLVEYAKDEKRGKHAVGVKAAAEYENTQIRKALKADEEAQKKTERRNRRTTLRISGGKKK